MPDDSPTRRIQPDDQPTIRGLVSGQKLFGRYILEGIAGRGGMGVVWRAQDEALDRDVALKLLPETLTSDPEAERDLKRETKRCLELTHPNIVRVHDFVQDPPIAAIVMEFVAGQSLAKKKAEAPEGYLTTEELAPLAAQLCAALDYAHRVAKVAHRDLKPANILVTTAGTVKVTDFGIARSLSETRTRLSGRVGDTSGTLPYMSPQQLLGKKASASDDIYALGATLYELLTGKPPFYTGDITYQILNSPAGGLTQQRAELGGSGDPIPHEWETTILACLAKEPKDRPQSAQEVADWLGLAKRRAAAAELQPAVAKEPTGIPPVRGPQNGEKAKRGTNEAPTAPQRPRALIYAVLAAVFLGLATAGGYSGVYEQQQLLLLKLLFLVLLLLLLVFSRGTKLLHPKRPTVPIVALGIGSIVVAIGACLGSSTDGDPSLSSTLSLPFVLVTWMAAEPLWVFPVLSVAGFIAWTLPYSERSEESKRSLYAGTLVGILSLVYYGLGYSSELEYQGPDYFYSAAAIGAMVFASAMLLLLRARKKKNPSLRVAGTAILFCWMSWLAFPYLGMSWLALPK